MYGRGLESGRDTVRIADFYASVFFSRGLRGKMTRNIGIASAILAIHSQLQALELSSCIFKPELRMVAVQAWTPFH